MGALQSASGQSTSSSHTDSSIRCAGVYEGRRRSGPTNGSTREESTQNRDPLTPTPPMRQASSVGCVGSGSSELAEDAPSESTLPPCKLLSLLAENPAADITQVPIPLDSDKRRVDGNEDGIECSRAYKMLMHYAISDEKMDDIAKALEEGCTPMKGGGCKIQSSAILSTLDKIID
jgi:hypothetical protein